VLLWRFGLFYQKNLAILVQNRLKGTNQCVMRFTQHRNKKITSADKRYVSDVTSPNLLGKNTVDFFKKEVARGGMQTLVISISIIFSFSPLYH
jgi:hypothetical protein